MMVVDVTSRNTILLMHNSTLIMIVNTCIQYTDCDVIEACKRFTEAKDKYGLQLISSMVNVKNIYLKIDLRENVM